ncbi:MAG TPA: serine hydrolase domain-containing protein [Gemmatimonadaceae bacterium]
MIPRPFVRARSRAAALALAAAAMLAPRAAAAQRPLGADTAARVDAVFARFDRADTPGCALGVYRDGAVAYARGYGAANLEHGIMIGPRTVFDIGSTSKQVTAMSVALLAKDGVLSLDDDVRRWIPELPAYERPITIRMLLSHTSGLRDYLTLMALRGTHFDGVTTGDDALALIVRQRKTNFTPGSEYLYSNSGFYLLSEIVERASGKSLPVFARERIFEPLGMRDTHFHDDHTLIVPRRATGYAPRREGGFRIDMSGFEQVGDGAVYTSIEELQRWDENFYDGTVGGAEVLGWLQTPSRLSDGEALTYALGLVVDRYRGLPTVRHGGSWAGYRAELLRFPEQHTSIAVLCNVANANPSRLANEVADLVFGSRLGERPAPAPARGASQSGDDEEPAPARAASAEPGALAALAGDYLSDELDIGYTLAVDSGRLVVRIAGAPERPLVPTAPDTFDAGDGVVLRFRRDGARRVLGFSVDAGRVRGIEFVRVERAGAAGER